MVPKSKVFKSPISYIELQIIKNERGLSIDLTTERLWDMGIWYNVVFYRFLCFDLNLHRFIYDLSLTINLVLHIYIQ